MHDCNAAKVKLWSVVTACSETEIVSLHACSGLRNRSDGTCSRPSVSATFAVLLQLYPECSPACAMKTTTLAVAGIVTVAAVGGAFYVYTRKGGEAGAGAGERSPWLEAVNCICCICRAAGHAPVALDGLVSSLQSAAAGTLANSRSASAAAYQAVTHQVQKLKGFLRKDKTPAPAA